MFTVPLGDGFTTVTIDGDTGGALDPSVPLVVLLHGLGGTAADMTAPLTSRGAVAFNQAASYPLYRDEGFRPGPPVLPIARFYADPPLAGVTSWRDALNAAGFPTATYTQNGGTIGVSAAQLVAFASGPLSTDARLSGARIAFVGHSRGGVIARSFLVGAAANAALTAFLGRVVALITLHSPHGGSGLAGAAVTVDALAARLQALIMSSGLPPLGVLAMLRSFTASPDLPELAPGSAVLATIAAGEPVPGVAYHTFGGTSTRAIRVFGDLYTPDSTLPFFIPFVPIPLFHWGSTPLLVGRPLDVASFVPAALIAPMPFVPEILTLLGSLAATTPELAHGFGDVLVTNASAHLPFSATRTANALNHAEALWDRTLQSQVIATLARLRTPVASGRADARITPYPASIAPANHTVTARDAVTGMPVTGGSAVIYDTHGGLVRRVALGTPFNYGFAPRQMRVIDPDSHRPTWEVVWPSVQAELLPPYGVIDVDIGRG
jgi:predicted esterase